MGKGLGEDRLNVMDRKSNLGAGSNRRYGILTVLVLILLSGLFQVDAAFGKPAGDEEPVDLTVFGMRYVTTPYMRERIRDVVLREFRRTYPHIRVRFATGLALQGKSMDYLPLMQIAGNVSPDVMFVNFRMSDTYIRQGFLYPLDEFVDQLDDEELAEMPEQIWPVIKRPGPDGQEHIWAWPTQFLIRGMAYRRDLFQHAGLPDRTPEDWDELMEFARKLTDPEEGIYGLYLLAGEMAAWDWMPFLRAAGGDAMRQDEDGEWRSAFACDRSAESALFYARLFMEPWTKEYIVNGETVPRTIRGVVFSDASQEDQFWNEGRIGMKAMYFGFDQVTEINDPDRVGVGPPPRGPSGHRGSEFNSKMMGIYAGVQDPRVRQAAWNYIHFWRTDEARRVIVDVMVENGMGRFIQPELLEQFGYFEYVRMIPDSWREAFHEAIEHGVPEPYGRNSQQVYTWMTRPLGQIRHDSLIRSAIERGDNDAALAQIKSILEDGARTTDEKMIEVVPPEVMRFRRWVALGVAVLIMVVFTAVFAHIWKVFSPPKDDPGTQKGGWQFRKYKIAYLIMLPAVGSIALWQYYPLARGVIMAFQNYQVTGQTRWVGLDNFAAILFDEYFWHAMWVSAKYSFLFILFGFTAPIALAILLQEVPRGKVLYRVIFYLPQILTGVVVMFLWKSFYQPTGFLNQLLGWFGTDSNKVWLDEPQWALIACLIPVIWAGMGPGCLIYLAALKTIPDDLYEAANIDGAGILHKIIHVTLPSLKALIIINFIGAFIGSFQSSQLILAMTGGGPYTPHGATEVADLQIFYTAFYFLRFGMATAMAWIIGLLLIGFTVIQLRRLRNMEFTTAKA